LSGRRLVGVALALGLLGACAQLRDPIQPWQVDVSYQEAGKRITAVPAAVTVDGPFGYVVLTNDTSQPRGFAIDDLAVYERINPEVTLRIRVEEARDHRTYVFFDQLHPGTLRGTIRTRFLREQER
jgi:hypothetical protein